jgi:hypothetical protein
LSEELDNVKNIERKKCGMTFTNLKELKQHSKEAHVKTLHKKVDLLKKLLENERERYL